MAFEPLIQDPADQPQPEPPKEDPLDKVAAQIAAMNERINQAYQQNKGIAPPQTVPNVQYVPYPVAPQEQEPQLTDADILADLPGTISSLADQIAAEREQALRQEFGNALGQVYEKDFERDLDALKSQPHFKFVEAELRDHFDKNPNEKFQRGRLMEKYNALAYSKLSEIQEAERQAAEANEPARVRTVDHPIPVSSSPPAPSRSEEDIVLTPEEEAHRVRANKAWGTAISKAEWVADQKGELFPTDYEDTLAEEM